VDSGGGGDRRHRIPTWSKTRAVAWLHSVEQKNHGEEAEEKRLAVGQSARKKSLGERKRILTLICGSVYHVMNKTYIHLRAKGPNIYMYKRERIYKEYPDEIQ
jgi:hypothetical protein